MQSLLSELKHNYHPGDFSISCSKCCCEETSEWITGSDEIQAFHIQSEQTTLRQDPLVQFTEYYLSVY